jgi:hypothetical protein
MIRAEVSAPPPAAKPTYIVTVFFGGKSCACIFPINNRDVVRMQNDT